MMFIKSADGWAKQISEHVDPAVFVRFERVSPSFSVFQWILDVVTMFLLMASAKKTSETSWMCQVFCWFWPLRCTQPRIDEAASSKSFPCTAFLDLGFSGLCVWGLFWVFPLCSAASAEHVRVSFERDVKGWTRLRILDLVSQNLVNVALVRRNLKADSCFKITIFKNPTQETWDTESFPERNTEPNLRCGHHHGGGSSSVAPARFTYTCLHLNVLIFSEILYVWREFRVRLRMNSVLCGPERGLSLTSGV